MDYCPFCGAPGFDGVCSECGFPCLQFPPIPFRFRRTSVRVTKKK